MAGVNKVTIVGRLGQDPEMKAVGQGSTVTRLNVATSESWVGKDGQKQERTEWHRVVVWGKLAEICAKYLSKGKQVYLEGKLQTRSWDDNGVKKYSTEIIASSVQFLGNNDGGSGGGSSSGGTKKKVVATSSKEPDFDQMNPSDFDSNDFGPDPFGPSDESGGGEIPF